MLKIGEFSKLSRVSVRMLRHYDEVGLLAPSEVDSMTGYRYYSERQLITAGRIAALRALGFGLSETRELLRLYDDRAALDARLAAQRTRLEALAADTAQKLRLLDTARERLRKEADMNYNVTIRTLPERYAACVRMTIPCYDAEGMVWDVLCRETDHMHLVPDAGELLRRREPRRSGADDRDLLAGARRRRLGHDPALLPALVGDRLLDRLDRHRHVLEVERAGFLAGRGADAAGEFREVVGGVEVAQRILPAAGIDQLVPVRNLVMDRATGRPVAERDAAIHAARRLLLDVALLKRKRELAEMPDAVAGELILLLLPVEFEKARDLAHAVSLAVCAGRPRARALT